MMRIEDYMQDAVRLNATEMFLCSSQKPKMKVATSWKYLDPTVIRPNELREEIFALIPEEQKASLIEEQNLQLTLNLNERKCDLQISIGENGFNLHARWQNHLERLTDFAIPQSVIEVFRRGEGLSLITGSRASGKTTLAKELIEKVSESGLTMTAYVVDQSLNEDLQDAVIFQSDLFMQNINLVRGFDFVVVDSLKATAWRQAVQLAEIGVRVLLILPFADIQTATTRLAEKVEANSSLGLQRVVHHLQIAMSLKLASAFDQKVQPVFDLLFATAEIKNAILSQNWPMIVDFVRTQGEKTGMRTMNQSLLSLMLKRKIDIKAGFAASPAPEELDRMLEKVGF